LTLLNSKIIQIRRGWFVTWIKFHNKQFKAVSTVWEYNGYFE
jgi:hypothetical protein